MKIKAANFLTIADNIWDYIPIISTISSIVNLFIKIVVLPWMDPATVKNNSYFRHLHYKNFDRLVILCVPIFGNIVFGVIDFLNREFNSKPYVLNAIKQKSSTGEKPEGHYPFSLVSKELRDDKEVVMANASTWFCNLADVSAHLRKDKEVVMAYVSTNPYNLKHASARLQDDEKIVLAAAQHKRGTDVLHDCGPKCQDNETIATYVVAKNGLELQYASERVRNIKNVVLVALQNDSRAFQYASLELQSDPDAINAYNETREQEKKADEKLKEFLVKEGFDPDMFSQDHIKRHFLKLMGNTMVPEAQIVGYRQP